MGKTNDVKNNFSALLRDCLRNRYGRIPSAAVVAREFNLRAYDTTPISQESARRWIRGVSLPEEERLRILVEWLDLDFNEALRAKSCYPKPRFMTSMTPAYGSAPGNGQQPGSHIRSSVGSQSIQGGHGEEHLPGNGFGSQGNGFGSQGDGHLQMDEEFMRLILALTEQQRKAITELIKTSFSATLKSQ